MQILIKDPQHKNSLKVIFGDYHFILIFLIKYLISAHYNLRHIIVNIFLYLDGKRKLQTRMLISVYNKNIIT